MKIVLIFILINIYSIANNNINHNYIETQKEKQINDILNKIRRYKEKMENDKKELQNQLDNLREEFRQYKKNKEIEILRIKNQLKVAKKELLLSKKKPIHKKVVPKKIVKKKHIHKKVIPKKVVKKKHIHKKVIPKKIVIKKPIHKRVVPKKIVIKKSIPKRVIPKRVIPKRVVPKKIVPKEIIINKITPMPYVKNLPWIKIVVENNMNIYELALKYYGDKSKYIEIYSANQNIIGNNLKIYNGMSLKIPMINQFIEQPIILNIDQ